MFSRIVWEKGDIYVSGYGYGATKSERTHTAVECRRHAPRLSPWEQVSDGWPVVNSIGGCGEHQPVERTS